ncbi:MAG: hypothetical protein RBR87_14255 [Bacteroidales bacterium]|jgi:hypothetical protein|nr:hypothetical protein [Bacteroidales bacterium]
MEKKSTKTRPDLTALIPDKEHRQEIVSRLWEYWSDGVFYAVIDFRGVAM